MNQPNERERELLEKKRENLRRAFCGLRFFSRKEREVKREREEEIFDFLISREKQTTKRSAFFETRVF